MEFLYDPVSGVGCRTFNLWRRLRTQPDCQWVARRKEAEFSWALRGATEISQHAAVDGCGPVPQDGRDFWKSLPRTKVKLLQVSLVSAFLS